MGSERRVRAAFTHSSLKAFEHMHPDEAEAVRRTHARLLSEIRSRGPFAWLPVELDIELTDVIHDRLGVARARAFWRSNLREIADTPILGPVISGAMRLFGTDPWSLVRLAHRIWVHLYRNCGWLESVRIDGQGARVLWFEPPLEMVRSDSFVDALAGGLEAVFDLCRVEGQVVVEKSSASDWQVAWRLTWRARR